MINQWLVAFNRASSNLSSRPKAVTLALVRHASVDGAVPIERMRTRVARTCGVTQEELDAAVVEAIAAQWLTKDDFGALRMSTPS